MRKRAIIIGVVVLAVSAFFFTASAFIGDAANAIDNVHWQGSPLPPCFVNASLCGGHILGTDDIGRDVLARLIVGGATSLRLSLFVLLVEALLTTLVVLGMRFGGGAIRYTMQRVADALSAVPAWPGMILVVLLWRHWPPAIAAAALIAPAAIGLATQSSSWPSFADRAARDWQRIIVLLATIDFLGFGVMPPTASWGNMLIEAETGFQIQWWSGVFPAIAITAMVLAIELCRRSLVARRPHGQNRNFGTA